MTDRQETLKRFVIRARRIASHSLAIDREALSSLSTFTLTGKIQLDGTVEMRRALPNEELFESLAVRVRPVLLKGEPVYYSKVLDEIQTRIEETSPYTHNHRSRLGDLRDAWSKIDLDSTNVLDFVLQFAKIDSSETTPQVSDTQLAAAWLYGDLVHADPRGDKTAGRLFPVKERYSAAVTYFAHAAALCLTTLDLVMELHDLGVIELDEDAVREDVVVGIDELTEKGVAYVGPVGSPMASHNLTVQELPRGFQPLTVTELLRQTPTNQVQVILSTNDGSTVCEYQAAVSRREEISGRLHWEALVADSVTFEVSLRVESGEITDSRFEGSVWHATTNRMKLAEAMLAREMSKSNVVSFHIAGQRFFSIGVPPKTSEELAFVDVSIDTLYDLVAVERITHKDLRPLTGNYKNTDRALLRRTRLLWEGSVVPFSAGPLRTTALKGMVPKVIMKQATTLSIADIEYPAPKTCIRHRFMAPESVSEIPGSDPSMDQMNMAVPLHEPFVCWAPEKREVSNDDDLLQPTAWALSHFDEQATLGRRG